MIILGVDPGSVLCGYGVVEHNGRNIALVEYGVIEAKRRHQDFNQRLKEIFSRLNSVIDRTNPDAAAFEALFYSKNAQSLIKLSHARAAAILAVTNNDIPIIEYSAREIKKSVTGRGSASKEQVQFMVRNLLSIEETPQFFDATDALAVAICHVLRKNHNSKKSTSWADYLKEHPELIISK
ncbi:MAG TPA: crossover junction endodeoxyribonuclease RuvC [Candidatus Kapabacteria bacterium]|jgi:crossover junction endodeoxyribonuclease RuvC|nr:crossover junction endodeoxyribonuclease RuvC [Candidatus Kapabacteria bacterium]HPP40391.1 crossover junction endodeoxyribonuclease RuvC [Candidatus Kapabacteria bacterium]